MKKIFFYLALLLTCFSCKINPIEKQVADEFIPFSNEYESFDIIRNAVMDKRILILGEAGHGDGMTFEIKSKLIEFLNKNNDYDIILEGMGFLDGAMLQGILPPLCINRNYLAIKNAWNPLWSLSKETQSMVTSMKNKEIQYWGMDCQPSLCDIWLIPYLRESFPYLSNMFDEQCLDSLANIHDRIVNFDTSLSGSELGFFDLKMNLIKAALNNEIDIEKKSILNMTIDNALAFSNMMRLGFDDWDAQNEGINIRDKQMAENVKWYLERFPKRKIIIWTANFHGAKEINQINYGKEPDKDLYNKYVLLGEYLENNFPEQVYSLAFTSGGGSYGYYYENDSVAIIQDSTSVEYYLVQNDVKFAYYDLSKQNNLKDKTFNSTLLGYDCKSGKWAQSFDGIFYIGQNHKAHEIVR